MKEIKTSRLTLGAIRECDFESLTAIMKNEEVGKTYMVPDLPTREAETKLFSRIRELSEKSDRYVFGIFLEDKLIGMLNDTDICGKTIEVGYAIHPDYHNQGFATEALGAVIPYLFAEGFDQVLAGAFETNTASTRVMEKCGMKRTKMTSEIEYRGKTHKCVYYSIKKN